MSATAVTHFTLGVKACQDALILLTEQWNVIENGHFVEIIIGEKNQQTAIRTQQCTTDPCVNEVDISTPGILSCTEDKYFWISWQKGLIQVGMGLSYGEALILQWQDPMPKNLQFVQVSTSLASTGLWTFPHTTGRKSALLLIICLI